jgi:hypothetical protein
METDLNLLEAAISYGESQFHDRDLSILCATSRVFNEMLAHTLERRKKSNVCKAAGDRYRRMNAIAEAYRTWRSGAGASVSSICYDPVSRSLCNAFCGYLREGDVFYTTFRFFQNSSSGFGKVTDIRWKYRDCDYYSYNMQQPFIFSAFADNSPKIVLIPPRTDII